jgi:inositol phosphorylceramide mannosyltransferase catalytic subunit
VLSSTGTMDYKMLFSKRQTISRLLILALYLLFFKPELSAKIQYPDFDHSMLRQGLGIEVLNPDFNEKGQRIYKNRNQEFLSFFKQLYYQNIKEAEQEHGKIEHIPRIVHQIWLGSPVPNEFREWMDSWHHEGWEYRLWTDEEIAKLDMQNRVLYDQSKNFAEKSDIARLEILYQYGGLYVDTDFECLNIDIFDELHRGFDFYIGFEPLEHGFTRKFNMNKFCNALIGSDAGHPLLHDLIVNMKANYLAHQRCCDAILKTGPSYLTRIICEFETACTHNNRNIYLPCTFFYPLNEPEIHKISDFQLSFPSETAGIHYWYGSWTKRSKLKKKINPLDALYSDANTYLDNYADTYSDTYLDTYGLEELK